MATATLKRTRAGNVPQTALDQVGSLLQDLPEKTKEQISLREAVSQLQDIIKAALAKGYSYEDVAALLAEVAIVISPTTLKRYVLTNGSRTTQKQASSKAKTKRKAKALSAEPISEAVQPEPEAAPLEVSDKPEPPPVAKAAKGRRKPAVAAPLEVEAEVEKPRRGRAAKTASAQPKAGSTQRSSATRGRRATKA
ncbi:MAG: hypothetical protein HY785_18375 [Oscillatoriophycideae cyanobacterium NC_groundwater_1537_Pr4_S-0.65um_50_18]|nr:hypothetical protein [Oscillatoriophycideae cyanobacterium NC_groundwater_1537_Pr4_S-0.65um_50_18]